MKVVECNDLTKQHGHRKALNNLTFSIEENKITGLIGRNGAGKTTLLKILAGYWQESAGVVNVFSERPFNNLFVSANTILVDDEMDFPSALTLKEILEQAGNFYEKWDMDLAFRLFDYFSFDPMQIHSNLSKGKTSTFNMIVGLASRCSLTIFDEPTSGMDAAVRKDFYRALLKDYLAHPRSIIISSHYLDELEDMLEDVLLIENGKEYVHLPMDELKEYAVGLSGSTAKVNLWIGDKEVLYKNTAGADSTYVIVKNDFLQETLDRIKRSGVNVSSVSSSDLCVYLTDHTKGGIDDVFDKA
ncbi:ATP-binding cassette domain-containing protein [Virgibacillus doumboii]|uniref:ATP-binding cassette domain-containing protein n=1 Tax=Virgibacillus doumboii TaxID=2697503 RepID=UPI0013E0428C|nr:ABC transporter ATP-binding protein [Virgibacillus doumboii]